MSLVGQAGSRAFLVLEVERLVFYSDLRAGIREFILDLDV